jgi:hypothetical protein
MKKTLIIFGLCVLAVLFAVNVSSAQDTVPPLTLPTDSSSATATATPTVTATDDLSGAVTEVVGSPTPTPTPTPTDVADTGSAVTTLFAISLLAGFGIYSIWKYKEIKKYSL